MGDKLYSTDAIAVVVREVLRKELRIKIAAENDYLGTPEFTVTLCLDDIVLSEERVLIPERTPYDG